jgi:hypothetical protein
MLNKYIKIVHNLLQIFSIWILKKTNYQFKIEHDEFNIKVMPIGVGGITRYDFHCKGAIFLQSIDVIKYFNKEELHDCPNQKTNYVEFDVANEVKRVEENYNKLIKEIIKSSKVVS